MKDLLFEGPGSPSPFAFDRSVASVFDDMIVRSVPCYELVTRAVIDLVQRLAVPGDLVVDLGCSTGTLLVALADETRETGLRLIGVDSSEPMIEQAIRKAEAVQAELRPGSCAPTPASPGSTPPGSSS